MQTPLNYVTNHIGMQQAKVPSIKNRGHWSVVKPHAFTMGMYEIALVTEDDDVQEPERFNTEQEVIDYITSREE